MLGYIKQLDVFLVNELQFWINSIIETKLGHIYNKQHKVEFFNQLFQSLFNPKSEQALAHTTFANRNLYKYQFSKTEIINIMEKLDINKAKGPDGIDNLFL